MHLSWQCEGVLNWETKEFHEGEAVLKWEEEIDSHKMLSVIDQTGCFIYVQLCLGRNDRDVLTSSPLYLFGVNYFSDNE